MTVHLRIVLFLIVAFAVASPIKGINPRKLDDVAVPGGTPDDQSKCGGCPCNKPCYRSPPPPPPPSPPPPKKPSPTPGVKCPPPPSGGGGGGGGGGYTPPSYIYVTGPPGDVYPVINPYTSAAHRSFRVAPPLLLVVGFLATLGFW